MSNRPIANTERTEMLHHVALNLAAQTERTYEAGFIEGQQAMLAKLEFELYAGDDIASFLGAMLRAKP